MKPTWATDGIELYCADARDVLSSLGKVDIACIDPPYGISLKNGDVDGHRSERSFNVAGDDSAAIGLAVLDWLERNDVPTVTFASPWKPWPGYWHNLIAWDKGGAVGGGGDMRTCLKRSWELIQVTRNGALQEGRCESVVRFPMVAGDTKDHICAKPVDLMEWLLRQFSVAGDTVLDCFMGSGSTGCAAVRTGRKFIGIEIDPVHFMTALHRIKAELFREPLFDAPPKIVQRNLLEVEHGKS